MSRLFLIALLLSPLAAVADEDVQIYRTVDEDGNVVYTDQPPSDDAEPVELDPITTVPAVTVESGAGGDEAGDEESTGSPGYSGLTFVYPPADATIRHNGGQVPFRLALQPEGARLAQGHRVEIVLDGEVRGSANALEVTVGAVDRGPHEVSARIVGASGGVLVRSPMVSFFLLRHSVQSP